MGQRAARPRTTPSSPPGLVGPGSSFPHATGMGVTSSPAPVHWVPKPLRAPVLPLSWRGAPPLPAPDIYRCPNHLTKKRPTGQWLVPPWVQWQAACGLPWLLCYCVCGPVLMGIGGSLSASKQARKGYPIWIQARIPKSTLSFSDRRRHRTYVFFLFALPPTRVWVSLVRGFWG